MLCTTSPGLSTRVCGIIGSCSGSVYSWMSRSRWTTRPGSERNGHEAPTEARNSWRVWCSSVALDLAEPPVDVGVVGELVVGERPPGDDVSTHGVALSVGAAEWVVVSRGR